MDWDGTNHALDGLQQRFSFVKIGKERKDMEASSAPFACTFAWYLIQKILNTEPHRPSS